MAREISTNGRKKVSTLMKEFNANYPYLRLTIGTFRKDGGFTGCDINKTLSEVRTKKGAGEISFTGSKNVATIEREFEEIFGLTVQICFTSKDGVPYYTRGKSDKTSLSQLNRQKEAEGCKKDHWY